MTPEQEKVLHKTHALVAGMVNRFKAIDERCAECHEELKNTRLILNGKPGNGEHLGLRARMALAEQSCTDNKISRQKEVRWFRVKLGAIITAALAIATKWILKG